MTMEIRVWGFQNYRDCGLHAIPINLKFPHSNFPINPPVNPCKHLQYTFWCPKTFFLKFWPYVWLIFKSGSKSRTGYVGARTVIKMAIGTSTYLECRNLQEQIRKLPYCVCWHDLAGVFDWIIIHSRKSDSEFGYIALLLIFYWKFLSSCHHS